jgi:Ca2+-binding EF-hand superfamily protein
MLLCSAALLPAAALANDSRDANMDDRKGTFATLDKDGDERLSPEEVADSRLAGSFSALDRNSDGFVSKGEFRRNTRTKPSSD